MRHSRDNVQAQRIECGWCSGIFYVTSCVTVVNLKKKAVKHCRSLLIIIQGLLMINTLVCRYVACCVSTNVRISSLASPAGHARHLAPVECLSQTGSHMCKQARRRQPRKGAHYNHVIK